MLKKTTLLLVVLMTIFLSGCLTRKNLEQNSIQGPSSDKVILKPIPIQDIEEALEKQRIDYHLQDLPEDQIEKIKYNGVLLFGGKSEISGLSLNTAKTERFNPFSNQKVRLALQYLVNRKLIIDQVYEGFGQAIITNLNTTHPQYNEIAQTINSFEILDNQQRGQELLSEGMTELEAELVDGYWYYQQNPVEIIIATPTKNSEYQGLSKSILSTLANNGFKPDKIDEALVDTASLENEDWNIIIVKHTYNEVSKYENIFFPTFKNFESEELENLAEKINFNQFSSRQEWSELLNEFVQKNIEQSAGIWLVNKLSTYASQNNLQKLEAEEYTGLKNPEAIRLVTDPQKTTINIGIESIHSAGEPWNHIMYNTQAKKVIDSAIHDPIGFIKSNQLEHTAFRWNFNPEVYDKKIEIPKNSIIWSHSENKWEKVEAKTTASSKITYDLSKYLKTNWHHGIEISWSDILYTLAVETKNPKYQNHFKYLKGINLKGKYLEVYLDQWVFESEKLFSFSEVFKNLIPYELYAATEKIVTQEISSYEFIDFTNKNHAETIISTLENMQLSEISNMISTPDESYQDSENFEDRKQAVKNWYKQHEHLFINDGSFYLDVYLPKTDSVILKAFRDLTYPFTFSEVET